ncbi:hypothetical protein G9A89_019322 [Geosiphon pyriformis]|nr:hypothetical protein G9A89_019322 [Geosiphon pyriformis]
MFSSGLDSGYVGASITIVMNRSLAKHIYKVFEVSSHLLCIRLLFKNKLLVSILGLYAGASLATQFSQADEINFLIAKTMNKSFFVILGGDFNEDSSYKYTSFRNVAKTIDYVFISSNLVNAIMQRNVFVVSEHFDMDHKAVFVSLSLGGLLDTKLNSFCKQTNKNQWKFNFKSVDKIKWNNFKSSMLANTTLFSGKFIVSVRFLDLDAMWCVVRKVVTLLANEIFKKKWLKGFNEVFTKDSSKFHKLELLVSRIVKALCEKDAENFVYLIEYWNSGAGSDRIHSAFFGAKKSYCVSKLTESLRAKKANIRSVINKRIESFKVNKNHMIRSVLECPFRKVVLDHLVVNDNLIWLSLRLRALAGSAGHAKAYDSVGWKHLKNIKHQKSICEYKLNSHFISKNGHAKFWAGRSFFFAAGAFVDNMIWVGSSQSTTQHILNIASEFFWINDISINNDKTVAIPINSRVSDSSLFISAGMVYILFDCKLSLGGSLASSFQFHALAGVGPLDICGSNDFLSVCNCLSRVGIDSLFVYMDGSLKNLDTIGCKAGAAAFFEHINLGLGVGV